MSALTWHVRCAATFPDLMNEYPENNKTALVAFKQAFKCGK